MDDPMAHAEILWLLAERGATLGHARLPKYTSISSYGPPGRHEGHGRSVQAMPYAQGARDSFIWQHSTLCVRWSLMPPAYLSTIIGLNSASLGKNAVHVIGLPKLDFYFQGRFNNDNSLLENKPSS